MNAADAIEIKNILEEEANVLARIVDYDTFKSMDHRVGFAVSQEIARLRRLAGTLPVPKEENK